MQTFLIISSQSDGENVKWFTTISICNHFNFDPAIKIKNGYIYNTYIVYRI
jgi:hypothetical protein